MGAFNTTAVLQASPEIIPEIVTAIEDEFRKDGYDVKVDNLISGGADISIAKGDLFKAVLGMKSALKITLYPSAGNIRFEAGVGIFGQQAIPTIISMFFLWPVILTQIWGIVRQSELDDRALEIAQNVVSTKSFSVIRKDDTAKIAYGTRFCPHCGRQIEMKDARFCDGCGSKL